MYIIATLFDKKEPKRTLKLKGEYFESFKAAFPDHKENFKNIKGCLAFFAGAENAGEKAESLSVKECDAKDNEVFIRFETQKETDINSGQLGTCLRSLSKAKGWNGKDSLPPLICFVSQSECEGICESARRLQKTEPMLKAGDYKAIVNLFAPLHEVKDNEFFWNNEEILYRLGLSCSKLSVTLKIKADETKKLDAARKYREFCVLFLERGAELEDGARCSSALAYRYYSNVHELTRPGERKDQNLEEQIEKANEWLSRAIESYPQSVRNNYRKGKLIIEKQAPYLLFGKKSFGEEELRLLREIREVGEEHLASAIAVYESLEEGNAKEASRREYAKALFVLGGYYLDDAYFPVLEYYFKKIAGTDGGVKIQPIAKLDIDSAIENLEKCFRAETDMSLNTGSPKSRETFWGDNKPDIETLAASVKKWARSPIEILYRLGCAYGLKAFISLAEENADKAVVLAKTSIALLDAAKRVSEKCTDRKRNTWHISEKMAWSYMHMGQFERAAKLLENAHSGYIINTYAIALLLAGKKENGEKVKAALEKAAADRRNLASGLTKILGCYVKGGKTLDLKNVSSRNRKLASILGIAGSKPEGQKVMLSSGN